MELGSGKLELIEQVKVKHETQIRLTSMELVLHLTRNPLCMGSLLRTKVNFKYKKNKLTLLTRYNDKIY